MKKKQIVIGLILVSLIGVLVTWGRDKIHFDFGVFAQEVAHADWRLIALGVGCIYLGYVFRAFRWAQLIRHNQRVSPFSLLGTQVMGFTAVALIGRVADPVRPYLVSKKTGLPISSQIAVYIVERLFDAGSMALIFSALILLAPAGSLPHPEIVKRAGGWGMLLTIAGALFLVAVRLSGSFVAALLERAFGLISKNVGQAVGHKVRTFHTGLDTIRSLGDFAWTAGLSIAMWLLITGSYLATARAFTSSPPLAGMNLSKCILLLAFSGTASVLQLPIIGWFTQIGFVAAALASFYGATPEASTACAAMLLIVTFLSVVPIGLVWAQIENVSLRKVTHESEHVEEQAQQDLDPNPVAQEVHNSPAGE
ncbi:MAG TPA: lysylphosphatidylglycerol synthase transmembrane domain-containing protein [Terracidiphilus sp.]|nr:lysylphosphatidylglycerol synthase transmembrane domain-containing protein [Terracidiphilus sp.]